MYIKLSKFYIYIKYGGLAPFQSLWPDFATILAQNEKFQIPSLTDMNSPRNFCNKNIFENSELVEMDGINLFNQFVALHKPQLLASGVPQYFWQTIYHKITTETFDAGEVLQLMLIEYDEEEEALSEEEIDTRQVFALSVAREDGLRANDLNNIFLVDHCWTFRLNQVRQQLESYDHLCNRICAITGVDLEDNDRVNKVMKKMWKYCQAYTLASDQLSEEDRQPIWYIMDEVGSAVGHSDEPNFRLVPFLHLNSQTTFSLLFPIKDVEYGDQVLRNYVEYVSKDAEERKALLLPWNHLDLSNESFLQYEPPEDYFLTGHIPERYASEDESLAEPHIDRNEPLKVYSEYGLVMQYLNSPCFTHVDNRESADILWLATHFKSFAELSLETPNKFINQFPLEYIITVKDLLSTICRRAAVEHHNKETLETYPLWLPATYNLKTEILQFASYYQNRANKGLDNHWIIKPWNLARGLDTHITSNLTQILRLPSTGPKIAQKYIENPVLFYRSSLDAKVKFDVRYVILLKSVRPLEAFVHRKFYLRFSNKPFSLDHFDDYEKHFTVMNYEENAELHHVKCEEFLDLWQEQYPKNDWSLIQDQICSMLYEMLECATKGSAPSAIQPCAQSRALYAADIMLDWQSSCNNSEDLRIQPKLLEVNWTPDCQRACEYYPEFYNDIFKLLFLNEYNDEVFRLLQ